MLDQRLCLVLPPRDIPGCDDSICCEAPRVGGQRIALGPERVPLPIDIGAVADDRVCPRRLGLLPEVEHVVVVRMPAHAHRDELDQRGSKPVACAPGCPSEGHRDRFRIGPVDGESRNAVADGLVGERPDRRLIAHRRGQRRLIVLDTEDRRPSASGAGVDRLVPLPQGRPAFADERHDQAPLTLAGERQGHAGQRHRPDRERRGCRQHTPVGIADVQVLPAHRRIGLGHLGGENQPHGFRIGMHRQRDADIANHRRNDVAAPSSIGSAPAGTTAQTQDGAVDRLLAKRSEAFSPGIRRRHSVSRRS